MNDNTPKTPECVTPECAENNSEKSCEKRKEQEGASLVEYALLVGLIAIIAIVGIRVLGSKISQQFSTVATQL